MKGVSLRTKVFLLFAGATLLTVVPALVLIEDAVERRVYERAREELDSGREALGTFWTVQNEALQQTAGRIASDPGVARLLVERDTAQLRRTLTRQVAEGRIVLALDSLGRSLVGPAVDSAMAAHGVVGWSMSSNPGGTGRVPVRIALWPVWMETDSLGPAQVGAVGVGAPLDSLAVQDLKGVTGADVALLVGDSAVATTLSDSVRPVLQDVDLPADLAGGIWRRINEPAYLYSAYRLPTRDIPAGVLFFRPIAQELRVATGITASLVAIGFAALVLALLLAGVVSRIVARPAQALAQAATQLARGDYQAPLPAASDDEIGQLAHSFAEMRTAIAEREARLRSAQAELISRERLAAMGRLVAQLSHEINNPIYNIQNCLEALERRGDPRDPNREFLELAQEELARMATLTRQLLDQSRPVSDAATPVDLNALARRVAQLAVPEMERSGIELELRLDPYLPAPVAHPDAIQQVLANLVENAIDAMPNGGSLRIVTRGEPATVEVAVEDTGAGIADEHLSHIFDAFYTTKPGVSGIGLGLFVSEGIVRGHRGQLRVESRVGKGSRFIVRLPREALDTSVDDVEALTASAESSA